MIIQQNIYDQLAKRIGAEHLSRRLSLQVDHSARLFGKGYGGFHWENIEIIPWILGVILKSLGLFQRGVRNSLDYQVVQKDVSLKKLPSCFHGLRILQLSDIHSDAISDQGDRLVNLLTGLKFDLCVITGDFRFLTFGDYDRPMQRMEKFISALDCEFGVIGILGNHDFIEMVPILESFGIKMLLNASVSLERGNFVIHMIGVDDPHFYGLHDLPKALYGLPEDEVKVLLAHSPEIILPAEQGGIDYYLCGHTHGGQICLPGKIPLLTNANCARRYVSGPWQYNKMSGYTSRGTGSSGLPVRFFCPPEVTIHRLISVPL